MRPSPAISESRQVAIQSVKISLTDTYTASTQSIFRRFQEAPRCQLYEWLQDLSAVVYVIHNAAEGEHFGHLPGTTDNMMNLIKLLPGQSKVFQEFSPIFHQLVFDQMVVSSMPFPLSIYRMGPTTCAVASSSVYQPPKPANDHHHPVLVPVAAIGKIASFISYKVQLKPRNMYIRACTLRNWLENA